MNRKPILVGLLLVAIVLGVLVYSTMNLAAHRVEVCLTFNGRAACRTASGSSKEFAQRAATQNACAELASGVTENLACDNTTPSKITWLK